MLIVCGTLPLDEAVAYRAVLVTVSRSDERAETLLEPAIHKAQKRQQVDHMCQWGANRKVWAG